MSSVLYCIIMLPAKTNAGNKGSWLKYVGSEICNALTFRMNEGVFSSYETKSLHCCCHSDCCRWYHLCLLLILPFLTVTSRVQNSLNWFIILLPTKMKTNISQTSRNLTINMTDDKSYLFPCLCHLQDPHSQLQHPSHPAISLEVSTMTTRCWNSSSCRRATSRSIVVLPLPGGPRTSSDFLWWEKGWAKCRGAANSMGVPSVKIRWKHAESVDR